MDVHSVVVQVCLRVGVEEVEEVEEVEGQWTGSDGVRDKKRRGGARNKRRKRQKRKEGRSYHDITPLLYHYVSEQCSFSLWCEVVRLEVGESAESQGITGETKWHEFLAASTKTTRIIIVWWDWCLSSKSETSTQWEVHTH